MRMRQVCAGATATALIVSGAVLGASAAQATDATAPEYVPATGIAQTTNAAEESAAYNTWHFDPSKSQLVTQQRNGITVPQGAEVLVRKGNGLDVSLPDAAAETRGSIEVLAESLDIVASDLSAVTYQIPVFFDYDEAGKPKYTTLRKQAGEAADIWTTSGAIGTAFAANSSAELDKLVDALDVDDDARAIGAGFLVSRPASEVLVSNFSASGTTTQFTAAPVVTAPGTPGTPAFVDAKDIRPDESSYPGWHEGVPAGPERGSFETVIGEKKNAAGLKITGKSQVLNGFAEDSFLPNAAGLAKSLVVAADAGGADIWAQIPVFSYPQGVVEQQFTTLRALVPASGKLADTSEWVSSRDIAGQGGVLVPKNTATSLDEIVAALGEHDVLGYGVHVESGSATIQSIAFNGVTTEFFTAPMPVDPGTKPDPKPQPKPALTDIPKGHKFYADIMWMQERGITTGNKQVGADGKVSYTFQPKDAVTREAMAAFMFRIEAPKGYVAPKASPFSDVKPGDKFYKEIAWMYDAKLSTGIKNGNALPKFAPKAKVTREAVAAFLYRDAAPKNYQAPKVSPVADLKPGDKFYKEIAWMMETKRSTGIKQPSGKPTYAPKANLSREAMAAFLHRADTLK
ncbi:minor extracellular serine protease [Leucobacter sp. 7(1)]|uniref:S-layer homology domain-containing protein n=1 Tax=Leucobacter sp. 7(1) TaxID=1255613 RepID=UPI00097E8CEA|nr:S-layer homology domain-containing protein [Leucobacter sp. 7(1)]SJN12450.1 minor extracellular serine protease [Leucobacter sp. 7(1)]